MRSWRILMQRTRSLLMPWRADADLDRELALHVELLTKENIATGRDPAEARLSARADFGSVAHTGELCRDARRVNFAADCIRDLRYAMRLLRKSPGFTLTAVITLALGVGANTAVFSIVYSVLLKPLPFPSADRLMLVTESSPGNVAKTGSPLLRFRARAAENTVFEETAAYYNVSGGNWLVLGGTGSAERLESSMVSTSFFSLLGVQPMLGRVFAPLEEQPDGAKVFVASYTAWRNFLGGDGRALGRTFRLDGEPYTLVGVLPPGFDFPGRCSIWIPLGAIGTRPQHDRISHQFWMLGRLRRGVRLLQAQAELDGIQRRLAQAFPATDANWRVTVRPLLEEFVGNVRRSMWVLLGAVGFVLLIACANLVNLLIVRATARSREFAMRAALGAGRGRLMRQAFAETALLATGGAALALVLAKFALTALVTLASGSVPRMERPELSLPVLLFCGGLAVAAALIAGLAPGFHAAGAATAEALRSGSRAGSEHRGGGRLRHAAVVCEIALALPLLVGASLLLRSFEQLRHVDPGFHPDGLTRVRVALPHAIYPMAGQRQAYLRQLLERLNVAPGVEMAAAIDRLPLSGETNWGHINIVGRPPLDSAHAPAVETRTISANGLRALGIPLLRGRELSVEDVDGRRPVALINQTMARQFWPGADPLGQRIMLADRQGAPIEIVGVIGDVKDAALDAQSPPEMYVPYVYWNSMNVLLRGKVDAASLAAIVRAEARRLDPEVPVYDAAPLDDLIGGSLARQRFEMLLLGLFAALALTLAAVGVYGLLAFSVQRRTNEIGVRMALGARPAAVLGVVMSGGMKLVCIGIALGASASLALTHAMSGLLFAVKPDDPSVLAGVALVIAAVSALACWVPARRVLRVDVAAALRCD